MNRLDTLFKNKKSGILSVYFTAGYPELHDTVSIVESLAASGADIIEIGIPFSDPMADGPVIQRSSGKALENGMSLSLLFQQLAGLNETGTPLVLMGYLNPILQFGIGRFLDAAAEAGIDGVIIPDLPVAVYIKHYRHLFETKGISMIFLITPGTPAVRIAEIDEATTGFIYMVTSAGTTGGGDNFSRQQLEYFSAVAAAGLRNPVLAGFGIRSREGFETACRYVQGGITGSAFIEALTAGAGDLQYNIHQFIQNIRK